MPTKPQQANRITVGVMGSACDVLSESDQERLAGLAERLGRAIAEHKFVLVTGATTGIPDMVSRAAGAHGALTLGISPASNREEHADLGLPDDGAQVIVYTGFGFKGRNVINIRASDIVIIFGGGMGTLNEFTIAFDEGKVIGVLKGSGGIADHIDEIIEFAKKRSSSRIVFDEGPEQLLEACLEAYTDALD